MSKSDIKAKSAGAAKAQSKFGAYGDGNEAGHYRAMEWLANPLRGTGGGTLQYPLLEFAERLRKARTQDEIDFARGLIVGFCFAVERPAVSAALLAASAAREEAGHD